VNTRERGNRGEAVARSYLEKKGFEILCTNYYCRHGELDIVARDSDSLVFVEVKCRRTRRDTVQAIGPGKVRSLKRSALAFMNRWRYPGGDYRFMVLFVIMPFDESGPITVDTLDPAF
jgi:putative endonuclease